MIDREQLREYDSRRDDGVEKLFRRLNNIKSSMPIYTEPQAEARGLQYKYWKDETLEKGGWALTDDKYVSQCLNRKVYHSVKGETNAFVSLSCGRDWVTKASSIEYAYNKQTKRYNHTGKANPADIIMRRERARRAVELYVKQYMAGKVNYELCGKALSPTFKYPAQGFKSFLKKRGVRERVDKILQEALKENGISIQFALDILKKAAHTAEASGKTKEMLDVYVELSKLLGIEKKDPKIVTTERIELSSTTSKLLEDGESLKLERVISEPLLED
jgi:hypothetical protein